MKRSPKRTLHLERLEPRDMMTVSMSPYDQLLLELVNRARANPTAEAARYGIDLNQGLAAGTISTAPKQPLAPNQILINIAGAHSQDMLDNDYFSHTNLQGQSPTDRALAAGYSVGVGENCAWGGTTGPLNYIQHVYARHEGLFRSAGHRLGMLRPQTEEIGVGVRFGQFTSPTTNTTYNASMVTEVFGNPGINPVITGVVFTDAADGSANDDNFYSIGEQVTSGTITATNVTTSAVFTTNIGPSGGYALQVTAGTYNVVASAGGQSYLVSSVVVGSDNVKVDFETTTASGAVNLPPSLQPIADVQFALTRSTYSTSLVATDPENAPLTFTVTVQNLAYHLDQTLGLTQNTNIQDNWGGLGEKWLRGQSGAAYYITPFGDLFEWDGVSSPGSLRGDLLATLLPQYHSSLSSLHAAQPGLSGVTATVTGSTLNLTMNSSVAGTFVVTATVGDGVSSDSESFYVTKGFRVTPHDPPQDYGPPTGTLVQADGVVAPAWHLEANTETRPAARPAWIGNLRGDLADSFRPSARPGFTVPARPSWENQAERRADLHARSGTSALQQPIAIGRFTSIVDTSVSRDDDPNRPSVVASTFEEQTVETDALHVLDEAFAAWE